MATSKDEIEKAIKELEVFMPKTAQSLRALDATLDRIGQSLKDLEEKLKQF